MLISWLCLVNDRNLVDLILKDVASYHSLHAQKIFEVGQDSGKLLSVPQGTKKYHLEHLIPTKACVIITFEIMYVIVIGGNKANNSIITCIIGIHFLCCQVCVYKIV